MELIKDFFFYTLYQPFFNILIFLAWLIPGHSIGWAIITLTIVIRLVLVPTTAKSVILQKKMKKLQPKLAEIKQKYKNDPKAQQQALVELYKQEEVNPIGGCLPLLIQLPIFFVLYRVFINGLHTENFSILYSFTPHLTNINTYFFGVNLAKPELWILPIITGLLQFYQSKQLLSKNKNSNPKDDTQEMIAKQMTYLMPIMIVFFARSLPAALPLYWSVNSFFSIIQQWYLLRKNTDELEEELEELPDKINSDKANGSDAKDRKIEKKEYNRKKDTVVTIRRKNK